MKRLLFLALAVAAFAAGGCKHAVINHPGGNANGTTTGLKVLQPVGRQAEVGVPTVQTSSSDDAVTAKVHRR